MGQPTAPIPDARREHTGLSRRGRLASPPLLSAPHHDGIPVSRMACTCSVLDLAGVAFFVCSRLVLPARRPVSPRIDYHLSTPRVQARVSAARTVEFFSRVPMGGGERVWFMCPARQIPAEHGHRDVHGPDSADGRRQSGPDYSYRGWLCSFAGPNQDGYITCRYRRQPPAPSASTRPSPTAFQRQEGPPNPT